MVTFIDTTDDYNITITGTETWSVQFRYYQKASAEKEKETEKEKVTRLALERNRKSWVSFNQIKPTIKQFFKPRTNFNHRRV